MLFYIVDIRSYIVAYLCEIGFHSLAVTAVDDVEKLLELVAYLRHLVVGVGVEQYLLQQIVVLAKHSAGYRHVPLERCAGRVLMLHDCSKDESADKRNAKRIGNRTVVLVESVFVDVQSERGVELPEERLSLDAALADDYGVLVTELAEVCERGPNMGCVDT